MQRVVNYGSFLQAYSLKKTLEMMGHCVEFIDYHVAPPIVPYNKANYIKYQIKSLPFISNFVKKVNCYIHKENSFYLFEYLYSKKYLKLLGVTNHKRYHSKVDLLIIGSDEVFNCLQAVPNVGFSKELFGQYNEAASVISYAASFGFTTFEKLVELNVDKQIRTWMSKFKSISVRDENSMDILAKMKIDNCQKNVDPVFLYDFEGLIPKNVPYTNYIVIYTYSGRHYTEEDIELICDFAHRNDKKMLMIGKQKSWADIKIQADPFETLSYFIHADFVFTDTFHGTVFSIKYNKMFATLIRDDNKEKLGDLLRTFNLEERSITDLHMLQSYFETPIDFSITNQIIANERKRAISYLENNTR